MEFILFTGENLASPGRGKRMFCPECHKEQSLAPTVFSLHQRPSFHVLICLLTTHSYTARSGTIGDSIKLQEDLDWKPPKQLKCAYIQPIPHTNKKISSLIALNLFQTGWTGLMRFRTYLHKGLVVIAVD